MARSSGAIGVSRSSLARLAILPDRRQPDRVAALGDSRIDAITTDGPGRVLGAVSPLVWARAMLDARFDIVIDLGVSGNRTDQMLARIDAAVASGAGILYLQGGVNDIAQNWPTAATSGAIAAANLIAMAQTATAAGMQVVIELETGANSLTTAQVGQVLDLNHMLIAFAQATANVHIHDARRIMLDPAWAGAGTRFRAGLTYDGTHPSVLGGQRWGTSLTRIIGHLVPPRAIGWPATQTDAAAPGRRQLVANPLFAAAGSSVAGTGVTGSVPAAWTARCTGGSTAVASIAADPDGLGTAVTVSISFAAAGDQFIVQHDVAAPLYTAGDGVRAMADYAVTATSGALAGAWAMVEHNSGTGGSSVMHADLFPVDIAGQTGPDASASRMTALTRALTLGPQVGAGGWLTVQLRARALAAGTATLRLHRIALVRD